MNEASTENVDADEREIDIPIADDVEERVELIRRIEDAALVVIEQISSGSYPSISYVLPASNLSTECHNEEEENGEQKGGDDNEENSMFCEGTNSGVHSHSGVRTMTVDFSSNRSKDKLALMVSTMAMAHKLLISNSTITRRSFYYELKNENNSYLASCQRQIDVAVYHVAYLLNCSPWRLRLLATSKGLAAGNLSLTFINRETIDYSVPGGALIPQIATNVTSIRTRAKFVLVVEKDAVFQKLLEENCPQSLNCILITGKGYPDMATRMLIKSLSEKLKHSVYVLVDADPFGVDIMCIYRFGSVALLKENDHLACSEIRWLGIHPSELAALGARSIPLTIADLSKLTSIESRPYVQNEFILKELRTLRRGKAEIEAISGFTRNFLTATYLPRKIKGKTYI